MVNEEDGGINGRELVVEEYDTGTNDNGNRLAYEEACDEVFASVGSESAFDTGGYEAVKECGFPHLAGFTTDDAVDELDFVFPRTSADVRQRRRGALARRAVPRGREERGDLLRRTCPSPSARARAADGGPASRSGWEFTYEQPRRPRSSRTTRRTPSR